jgi:hypothetical protein
LYDAHTQVVNICVNNQARRRACCAFDVRRAANTKKKNALSSLACTHTTTAVYIRRNCLCPGWDLGERVGWIKVSPRAAALWKLLTRVRERAMLNLQQTQRSLCVFVVASAGKRDPREDFICVQERERARELCS